MTGAARRPPRFERKSDRTLYKATKVEIECDMLLAPLSREIDRMNEKWGIDRLPTLVGIETAEKWGKACGGLSEALDAKDPEKVRAWVGVCIRGLKALDAEAALDPHNNRLPEIWDCEHDGQRFCLIRDDRMWPIAQKLRPSSRIYTIAEVATALAYAQTRVVDSIKDAFPGAQVVAIRDTGPLVDDDLDDIFGTAHHRSQGEAP